MIVFIFCFVIADSVAEIFYLLNIFFFFFWYFQQQVDLFFKKINNLKVTNTLLLWINGLSWISHAAVQICLLI